MSQPSSEIKPQPKLQPDSDIAWEMAHLEKKVRDDGPHRPTRLTKIIMPGHASHIEWERTDTAIAAKDRAHYLEVEILKKIESHQDPKNQRLYHNFATNLQSTNPQAAHEVSALASMSGKEAWKLMAGSTEDSATKVAWDVVTALPEYNGQKLVPVRKGFSGITEKNQYCSELSQLFGTAAEREQAYKKITSAETELLKRYPTGRKGGHTYDFGPMNSHEFQELNHAASISVESPLGYRITEGYLPPLYEGTGHESIHWLGAWATLGGLAPKYGLSVVPQAYVAIQRLPEEQK